MKRKIVLINEEKCNGCGLCVAACQEGALQLVNGKAKLVSDSYCDGLGACLPECPAGAIALEEREAAAFDEEAVKRHIAAGHNAAPESLACGCSGTHVQLFAREEPAAQESLACSCPGTHAQVFAREESAVQESLACGCSGTHVQTFTQEDGAAFPLAAAGCTVPANSQLRQWPCQIKLVPVNAPYFDHAGLLIAADCTAYAYADIHQRFMRNKITLIGCPKLDNVDYTDKLTEILKAHEIKSVTVLRMEVPCCSGIAQAVKQALINSGKMVPWQIVIIATDGRIVEE